MEVVKLCDYGCGQSALFQFKNGKWCCCKDNRSCPKIREKRSKFTTGKKKSKGKLIQNINNVICNYGCGELAKYQLLNKKYCCSKHSSSCKKIREDRSILIKKEWKKSDSKYHTDEYSKKRSILLKEKWKDPNHLFNSKEHREFLKQRMLNGLSDYCNSCPVKGYKNHKEWMLNGGSVYMSKHIKNPSKPEILLREIVKKLYLNSEHTYQILNYDVDIALPEYKIAIEYDGWYHFDCKESIDYHNMRQNKIENEGWKFLRYTMYDKFPTLEQVKKDIEKIRKEIR